MNKNEKKEKFLIMMIGPTHSGKTTLGHAINNRLDDAAVVVEGDDLVALLKKKYHTLHGIPSKGVNEPTLKYLLFEQITKFALRNSRVVILSNSNGNKFQRDRIIKIAKKAKAKIIQVYFLLPEQVLRKRIVGAKKSKVVLTASKNFGQVLTRQLKNTLDRPKKAESKWLFTVRKPNDVKYIQEKILKIVAL